MVFLPGPAAGVAGGEQALFGAVSDARTAKLRRGGDNRDLALGQVLLKPAQQQFALARRQILLA